MPHPERVTDGISGSTEGAVFFQTIAAYVQKVGA